MKSKIQRGLVNDRFRSVVTLARGCGQPMFGYVVAALAVVELYATGVPRCGTKGKRAAGQPDGPHWFSA